MGFDDMKKKEKPLEITVKPTEAGKKVIKEAHEGVKALIKDTSGQTRIYDVKSIIIKFEESTKFSQDDLDGLEEDLTTIFDIFTDAKITLHYHKEEEHE